MEVEIKLNVQPEVAGGPAAFFARLAALRRLGLFRLGPASRHRIHDVYFDTADRRLGVARVALRRREQDGACFVTLKSPKRRDGALAVRDESEAPLNAASLAWVLAALVDMGLLGEGEAAAADGAAFAAGLPCGPLQPVLAAATDRTERAVFRGAEPVATLALDMVVYEGLALPPFHDVEAEAAGRGGEAELGAIQQLLMQEADGALAPGRESKLARGLRLAGRL